MTAERKNYVNMFTLNETIINNIYCNVQIYFIPLCCVTNIITIKIKFTKTLVLD